MWYTRIRKTKTKTKTKSKMKTNTTMAVPGTANVFCVDILVCMVTIVSNGNVRVQVQFVWTQSMQLRKVKGGTVMLAIVMAIVTAIDC
jgi:hypothetical protein